MPIYDYECQTCGRGFDQLRKLSDRDEDVECPDCGEKNAERRISLTARDALSSGGCGGGNPNRPMRFG